MAGYEDTNDAERLADDPTFRMLASRERRETSVALTSTLHWFETDVRADERNYQGLARLNAELVQREVALTAYPRSVYPGARPQAIVIKARPQQANATRQGRGLPAQACPSALRHSHNAVRATKP